MHIFIFPWVVTLTDGLTVVLLKQKTPLGRYEEVMYFEAGTEVG